MYHIIFDDALDIAMRIKEVDNCYGIRYNLKSKKLEVFDRYTFSLISVLPFGVLDPRTISYIRQTRRERLDVLLNEIDLDNEKKERERQNSMIEDANTLLEERMRKNGER